MNISILFGAGAEKAFDLCEGMEFAKAVLGLGDCDSKKFIKEFYKGIEKDEWYSNTYIQDSIDINKLAIASRKKELLTKNTMDWTVDLQEEKQLKEYVEGLDEKAKNDLIARYPSFMGILDEKFHTLIAPKYFGTHKFWNVITCYWRAYFCLACKMISNKDKKWIMENPGEAYKEMCEFARRKKGEESYYSILKKYTNIPDNNINIITTNYTPLCEKILDVSEDRIAYIHGTFKYFERAKELEVFDVSKNIINKKKDYFPFIFLQSGVKPIVCKQQIKEWSKAIDYLEKSECLLIIGYKANVDDNHINSILREYILSNKKVVFFNFDESDKSEILNRFRIYDNERIENFDVIPISEKDCYEKFNDCLKDLNEK